MQNKLTAPLGIDDIELRVGSNSKKSFTLLLYKTARADIKRLNEVCGTLWKNKHFYDNKGLICCEISIYNKDIKEWVSRVDVGTESNTEKEKGSYSDSFKRAGFRWGIGLELYNSPLIRINWEMEETKNGNRTIYKPKGFFSNNLRITRYSVYNGSPTLTIEYQSIGVVFDNYVELIDAEKVMELEELISKTNSDKAKFLEVFNVHKIEELHIDKYHKAKAMLLKKLGGSKWQLLR